MFELRPNLCNPACKDEFDSLKLKEGDRLKNHYDVRITAVLFSFLRGLKVFKASAWNLRKNTRRTLSPSF